jgi:hypothetical protein
MSERTMRRRSLLLILMAIAPGFAVYSQQLPPAYKEAVQRQLNNKFNENQIISFVYQVYAMYDRHVPAEHFLPL